MKNKNIPKKYLFCFSLLITFLMFLMLPQNTQAASNYRYEGTGFRVFNFLAENTTPIYRFFNNTTGDHFYTKSEREKNKIIANFKNYDYEGIAFYLFSENQASSLPVYRFFNTKNGDHFYTTSESEKNKIIANLKNYNYEGIAFYSPELSYATSIPIFRFFSESSGDHFYTISERERDKLITAYNNARSSLLGPDITVGLWSFTRDELREDAFEINANKNYIIKNDDNKVIGTINKDDRTKVKYNGDGELRVYNTINETISDEIVYFEAADGDNSTMIFDVHLPDYSYDEYRGKIKLRYSEDSKNIWVINTLSLEHYVWGDGELAGTGDSDHNRVMVTSFRTYGYWWIQYATKWASEGFKVNATPGNQIYRGYEYEEDHPRVKEAAEYTRGKIVRHDGETAITPYSSWTDGKTRSFEERWGSDDYPWCDSVDDPYGNYNADYWNHSYKSTSTLMSEGNHMVGLSAHGSLYLAEEKDWSWTKILNYYFDDIDIESVY